jgi:hypothetical protein
MSTFKLGRRRRTDDPHAPHLSEMPSGQTPAAPPETVGWTGRMPADFGMMRNQTIGNRACGAVDRALQAWVSSNGCAPGGLRLAQSKPLAQG